MSVEGKRETRCRFLLLRETQRPLRLFTLSLEGCVIFSCSFMVQGKQKSRRIVMIQTGGRYRIVLATCASVAEARRIGRSAVEKKLAACANIVTGVESIYRWKGKVERAREVLVVIKTTAPRLPDLEREVNRLHSYEGAEFIALPMGAGKQKKFSLVGKMIETVSCS